MKALAGVVLVLVLAGASCTQETYLKESKEQVEREQEAADAANASTTTVSVEDQVASPPTTVEK